MNLTHLTLQELQDHAQKLINQLAELEPFRQGSLTARYHTCGKAYCHCAQENDPGHGPYWTLSRASRGKNVAKTIKSDLVESTKQQIARFHEFQQIVEQLKEVNIRICDELLVREKQASQEAKKKTNHKNQHGYRKRNL
ncbi:MAG: hypothetical protein ISR78_01975 [Spirochaetia bacterium]|nr:hypothetical protein [Spirochaetia bacterium]